MTSVAAPFVGRLQSRFVGLLAVAPAVLLIAHLLPTSGPGLALRLAGAAACVLLLPGALILRALGWPSSVAVAVAASFVLSLAVVAFALALVFAIGTSILLAMAVLVAVSACAAVPAALRNTAGSFARSERVALAVVLGAALVYAGIVWWGVTPLRGDAFFHLARARKLGEFDTLNELAVVGEFKGGDLHPGYAFPLWHAVDALVARFAGVDVASVFIYLPAILVPLAFVLAYAAGCAVFRSPAGGLALVAAQAAYAGFSGFIRRDGNPAGLGLFEHVTQPREASHLLLVTAAFALVFSFVVAGGWVLYVALCAAGLALAVVHPTYAPYFALVVAGFLLARVVLIRGWEPLLTRTALALGGILVPFGLVLILLLPLASENSGVEPTSASRASELAHYGNAFTRLGDWFGLSPDGIARLGPVIVAGLFGIPLAGFAARRVWAALVLGGSLVVLAVVLFPPLFTALSDAISLSQSRRLPQFIPVAFALAGGCIVLSRFRAAGVALAAGAGLALALIYPDDGAYPSEKGGPGWAVWIAVAGGVAALAAGALLRTRGPNASVWAAAATIAFVVPGAVTGLSGLTASDRKTGLPPGVIAAVRADTAPGEVVFSDPATAYRIAAFAPVYINASAPSHVTDTPTTDPRARAAAARRFLADDSLSDGERRAMLARYQADWVLIDKRQPHPEAFLRRLRLVFEGGRYALYEVGR
jgi:hypothetical protein